MDITLPVFYLRGMRQWAWFGLACLALACKKNDDPPAAPTASTTYRVFNLVADDSPPTRNGWMVNNQVLFCCQGYGFGTTATYAYPLNGGPYIQHVALVDSNLTQWATDTLTSPAAHYMAIAYGLADGGTPIAPRLWIFEPQPYSLTGQTEARFGHAAHAEDSIRFWVNQQDMGALRFGNLTNNLMIGPGSTTSLVVTRTSGDTLFRNSALNLPPGKNVVFIWAPATQSASTGNVFILTQQ